MGPLYFIRFQLDNPTKTTLVIMLFTNIIYLFITKGTTRTQFLTISETNLPSI